MIARIKRAFENHYPRLKKAQTPIEKEENEKA